MKQSGPFVEAEPRPGRLAVLKVIALAFISLTIIFHLVLAAKGMSLYRDIHLGTALEYAKGKIDLLRPVIVGFDATGTPIAQEVPIWQACAALLFKCFGTWFGWANVTSLLFMLAALWPLFQIAKAALGERGAWWSLIVFVAQPLIIWHSGGASTDGSCLTMMLWFVYFGEKLVRTAELKWFLPAILFGALTATTKAPFFFCAGLACFFLLVFQFRGSARRWILLSAVGFLATAIFMAWTHYTNGLVARAEFPFVDLRLGQTTEGVSMYWWFFGDLSYRLNPAVWAKAGIRFLNSEFGSFAFVGLAFFGFFRLRSTLIRFWLGAGAITVLVFTHLVLNHGNYYLMLSPPIALSCAAALGWLENVLMERQIRIASLFPPVIAVLLVLAAAQGLLGIKIVLDWDPYPVRISKLIQRYTTPTDKILIQGGGWGGQELFLANRTGLSIWDTHIIEDPQHLKRLRELGYTRLVMISASPLLTAFEQTNPGGAKLERRSYRDALTPTAENWPTLFQSDDLLIKAIPAQ